MLRLVNACRTAIARTSVLALTRCLWCPERAVAVRSVDRD